MSGRGGGTRAAEARRWPLRLCQTRDVRTRADGDLVTERLLLRPLCAADEPELLSYRGRADVCRYLPFPPMDAAVVRQRLDAVWSRRELLEEGHSLTWGVTLLATGRLVGDVVLFLRSKEFAGGELGYVFHPEVAGNGFAAEACAAVLDQAFTVLDMHRVVARLYLANEGSARLARRLGMRQEAHFLRNERVDGEWTDELVFALLSDEWAASRAAEARGSTG